VESPRYGSAFRRRWWIVPLTMAVALGVGWLTTSTTSDAGIPAIDYQASTLLSAGTTNQALLTVLMSITPVAERAQKILGGTGDPQDLLGRIGSTENGDAGVFTISSSSTDPTQAEATANAFSHALIAFLVAQRHQTYDQQIASLRSAISDALAAGQTATVLALRAQIASAIGLRNQPIGVSILEPAHAEPVANTGFQPPRSRAVRLAIAAAIGLLAGIALILLLERFDSRIRTRETAEERFGYPVIGEIPEMRRKKRRSIVTMRFPTSSAADAFRLLGASVGVGTPEPAEGRRGKTILVTSPGPSEGKTTVVANLAAALAEEGTSLVTVVSADLRRSTIEARLHGDRSPGLADAAAETEPPRLFPYQQPTSIDRTSLVASGTPTMRPGEVLASPAVHSLIDQARAVSDWVLIDTSPILTATESALLVGEADLVLLVASSGRTSARLAARTHETLEQLAPAAVRVVVNGAKEVPMPSGYRRYYRASDRKVSVQSRKG
jgi:capsular exopolysaccharide synthesis family protein